MTVRLLAFTQKGMELARRLAAELSGELGQGIMVEAALMQKVLEAYVRSQLGSLAEIRPRLE